MLDKILFLALIILGLCAVAATVEPAQAAPCWQELNGMVRCGWRW